jgi:hypothetical protein
MGWREDTKFGIGRIGRLFLGETNGQLGTEVTATAAELNIMDGVTATAAEINGAADLSGQAMSNAGGFQSGAGTILKTSVRKTGELVKTEVFMDLTDAKSSTTDLDIIGESATLAAYLFQITAAVNGTIVYGEMTCIETPAGGIDDIDVYSATEATGKFDTGIGTLTEAALLTKGGSWTAGVTRNIVAAPAANQYIYLTGGAAGTADTYTAGQFLLEFWGY